MHDSESKGVRDLLGSLLLGATEMMESVWLKADKPFDRAAAEQEIKSEAGRVRPGHSRRRYLLAWRVMQTAPGQLTDDDIDALAVVDEGLAARARARRASKGPEPWSDADKRLAKTPVSVKALLGWYADHVRPTMASLVYRATEARQQIRDLQDRLEQAIKQQTAVAHQMDDRMKALEAREQLEYLGVWDITKDYRKNHAVTHDGSVWIARKPSRGVRPPHEAWQLAVKRGGDGKVVMR